MFDRCLDRTGWTPCTFVLPQSRMELVELPHLSVGTPSQVGVSCVLQVEMRKLLETTSGVKAGRQLIGEPFNVHESVGARRADRLFVEALRIELPIFDPGNLGSDQRCMILEILRTIRRQRPKLSLVHTKCFSMHRVGVGTHRLAPCSAAKASIEMAFGLLQRK